LTVDVVGEQVGDRRSQRSEASTEPVRIKKNESQKRKERKEGRREVASSLLLLPLFVLLLAVVGLEMESSVPLDLLGDDILMM